LFRVCIKKKLGEKTLFDSLSSHAHSPARARRERERDEKQKTEITDRAALFPFLGRDYIPSFLLDEWGRSTPRALVRWLDFLLLLFFLHPRGKKNVFQEQKKGEKYERKRVRERPRAEEEEEEEEERHNDRFFFGSRLLLVFCFPFGVVVVVVCGEKKARGVRGRRRRRRRLTLGGPKEREKRYHLTEISIYLSIYLEFNDGTEENPHRTH
jgi:hypothetical protein